MKLRAVMVLACLALGAGACVKPTPYAPAGSGPYGYSDTQIDDDTVRIEVAGNSKTPRDLVENQLLYRAAQLAQARGDATFVFLSRDTEKNVRYWSQPIGGFYPYGGWGGFGFFAPFRGYGLGYAPITYRAIDSYTVYAEARFYKEEAPAGLEPAFNADEVLKNLKNKINRQSPARG